MNIPAAVPVQKVELKEGMEVYCHKIYYWADGSVSVPIGWHAVAQDQKTGEFYLSQSGWCIREGYAVDSHLELLNPRYPEKDEKDNNGWISVKDSLPEHAGAYLVYMPEYDIPYEVASFVLASGNWLTSAYITHWQPLPQSPTKS